MPDLKVLEPPPSTALERLVDDYLAACRARGLSPKTVKFVYAYVLKQVFLPFCKREGVEEPARVNRREVRIAFVDDSTVGITVSGGLNQRPKATRSLL